MTDTATHGVLHAFMHVSTGRRMYVRSLVKLAVRAPTCVGTHAHTYTRARVGIHAHTRAHTPGMHTVTHYCNMLHGS